MSGSALPRSVTRPAESQLFAPTLDYYGVRLALVFGNHAPGGRCVYHAAGRCHHCDIGAGEGVAFTPQMNHERLAWFQEYYRSTLPEVMHLVLYNSGSFLSSREMPIALLDDVLAFAGSLPALQVLSLESRENEVTRMSVRRVVESTKPDVMTRVILGLETADDHLRNAVLAKGMPREAVKRAVEAIGSVAAELGRERVGVTFNVLVGGPGTTEQKAVDDAAKTARFAWQSGRDADVMVDLGLHPYYRGTRGRSYFPSHPPCSPQLLAVVTSTLAQMAKSNGDRSTLFIGTNDEGHDTDRNLFDPFVVMTRKAFDEFNRLQDPSVLESVCRTKWGEEPVMRGACHATDLHSDSNRNPGSEDHH